MNQGELDARTRARLYAQLATGERVGLPLRNAVETLLVSADKALHARLAGFQEKVSAGADVAEAGSNSGLFLAWETRLIQAAAVSGKLEQSFAALARRYADRASRYARIRNGLVLPFAVMVVAVFVAPLPALFRGDISGQAYLLLTAGRLLLFFSALYLLSFSWRRLGASGADNTVFRLLLHIPCVGPLIRRQQQRDFLHSLALLLAAGVPVFEALAVAADSVSHPTLRERFSGSARAVRNGTPVTDALRDCSALPGSHSDNILRAGEVSGRSDEMLSHLVAQMDEQLHSQYRTIADWTPRLAYVFVLAFFVSAW